MQTGELKNMISELLGIQYNIEKARLDGKVQNLASYINEKTLIASDKEMDGKKAKGIDGIAKDDYSVNLEANVEHLIKRMKNGSYQPEPIKKSVYSKRWKQQNETIGNIVLRR